MTTPFRGFEDQVENTLQPGVAHNQLAQSLDAAIYGNRTIDFTTDADLVLIVAQCDTSVMVFTDSGTVLTTGRDVVFPAAFPSMLVVNATSQDLTLKKDGETGIVLAAGESVRISSGPDDVVGQSGSGGGGSVDAEDVSYDNGASGLAATDAQAAIDEVVASLRKPAVQSVSSSATVTPTFSDDLVKITAQAAALALANPTGTAIPGLGIVIRIKDNGTPRAISYGSQYRAIGLTLPTTTVANKTTYIAMIYNADDTKWDCVATGTEA